MVGTIDGTFLLVAGKAAGEGFSEKVKRLNVEE